MAYGYFWKNVELKIVYINKSEKKVVTFEKIGNSLYMKIYNIL